MGNSMVASLGMIVNGISVGFGGRSVAVAMMLEIRPGSRFDVGMAVGNTSVPTEPMMLVRSL